MNCNIVTILGPTASGKTTLAAFLAYSFNGEIISADSRQVYRGMDIGTGKDISEYTVNSLKIPYHLIDIISPQEPFSVFDFQKRFAIVYNDIVNRGKTPFLVGGSGLYLSSVLENYRMKEAEFSDEETARFSGRTTEELKELLLQTGIPLHNTTDLIDRDRIIRAIIVARSPAGGSTVMLPELRPLIIGVGEERAVIRERITARLKSRLNNGMIEEVKNLMSAGISEERLAYFGLEYKYISEFLLNRLTYEEMFSKLNIAIHQFAKRQMTWFRRMERHGVQIHWLQPPYHSRAQLLLKRDFPTSGRS